MRSAGELGKQVGQQPGTRPVPWDRGAEQEGSGSGKALAPRHRHPGRHQRGQRQQVGGGPPRSVPAFSLKYS